MSDTTPDVSPTGAPVFPVWLPKAATALVGLAAVGAQTFPPNTFAWKICFGIVSAGAALGISSQGWRKPE